MGTLITGSGEMADRIRAHDWAATALGPVEEWSETLVVAVNLMLHSPFPTILSWGPEMVFLYNDAGITTLMGKHPGALGADIAMYFKRHGILSAPTSKPASTAARPQCETTYSSLFS